MAWSPPRTWNPGETVTAALMNTHVRDNLNVLKTRIDDSGFLLVGWESSVGNWANSGSSETDAFSWTIPANYLADGDYLWLRGVVLFANNGSSKTLRLDIAGQKFSIVVSSAAVSQNRGTFDIVAMRQSSTTLAFTGLVTKNAASGASPTINHHSGAALTSLDFTSSQAAKFTLQGAASSDIQLFYPIVGAFRHV